MTQKKTPNILEQGLVLTDLDPRHTLPSPQEQTWRKGLAWGQRSVQLLSFIPNAWQGREGWWEVESRWSEGDKEPTYTQIKESTLRNPKMFRADGVEPLPDLRHREPNRPLEEGTVVVDLGYIREGKLRLLRLECLTVKGRNNEAAWQVQECWGSDLESFATNPHAQFFKDARLEDKKQFALYDCFTPEQWQDFCSTRTIPTPRQQAAGAKR